MLEESTATTRTMHGDAYGPIDILCSSVPSTFSTWGGYLTTASSLDQFLGKRKAGMEECMPDEEIGKLDIKTGENRGQRRRLSSALRQSFA